MEGGVGWWDAEPEVGVVDVAFAGLEDEGGGCEVGDEGRGEGSELGLGDVELWC